MAVARPELDLTPPAPTDLGREAAALSARMPELLLQARFVSNTVAHGIHGRRRAGPGETFWQFRHFQSGEPAKRVDWRRSARDDHLYVREKEWEAAHTVWIWLDRSPSMYFGSSLGQCRKIDRAVVMALALIDLLIRGGERVGLVGLLRPTAQRHAVERAAVAIAREPLTDDAMPTDAPYGPFSELIAIGDFLEPLGDIESALAAIAGRKVHGHLAQILDPVEEAFPFTGRTEFHDPTLGLRYVAGRAETVREAYRARMAQRRDRLKAVAGRIGWSQLVHHTDRPAQEPVLALHARLSGGNDPRTFARGVATGTGA
ncbi:DUF58 domain-containing protein [Microbaculum marinisediminis]|uniref:DUF58 domain-containing protein n=1 Tax=Microbaculum marinisediminis TaxID=2931392 RepID=A0AAW5QY52_9HYPH|nr:DUF58 domain-containing protein [Microbaculum sp. A6E488]MCT8971920.1 DUF58 domain-containing protein [Microbaculum sp. A6E488]